MFKLWLIQFFLNSLLNFVSSSKVCQLRERRLDLEEELAEEKKTSETLKKEYDALVKKAKVIDSALKTAEADLEAFQVMATASYIEYHEMENTLLWLAKPILPQFCEISNVTLTVIVQLSTAKGVVSLLYGSFAGSPHNLSMFASSVAVYR